MRHAPYRISLAALFAAAAAAGIVDAAAATICVTTGTQLANALGAAATNGEHDTIKMVEGVFTSPAGAGFVQWGYEPAESDAATSLTLVGGFEAGCSTAEPPNAASATQLDAQRRGPVFVFEDAALEEFSGQVILRNFTATRGLGRTSSAAAAIDLSASNATAATRFELERTLVVAALSNGAGQSGAVRVALGEGSVRVRGNVVHDNQSTSTSLTGLSVSAHGSAFGVVTNNTSYGNVGTRDGSGMSLCGALLVANNAVAQNLPSSGTAAQVDASTSTCTQGLSLRNNHFANYHLIGAPSLDEGTTTGDPLWTIAGSYPIPNGVSPLRDSGINNPLAGLTPLDIRGNARLVNGTVDRGAVEAPVVPATGPSIIPISHVSDTYTDLGMAAPGTTLQTQLTFAATGGNLGSTTMNCSSDTPVLQVVDNASQTVFAGQPVAPVTLAIGPLTMGAQGGVITCVVAPQGGNSSTPMFGFGATGVANFLFRDGFESAP